MRYSIGLSSLVFVLPLALVFASGSAMASPPYPAVVQEQWALPTTPACTLCHATDSGGTGTVVTYFGRQMQAFGLRAEDESSLIAALARDKTEHTDSDGDGEPDYDALVSAKSPNSGPGPKGGGPPAPEWGCAMGSMHARSAPTLSIAIAFVFALCGALRRKRSAN